MLTTIIGDPSGGCHLHTFDISLEPWVGKEAKIELVNEPTGWYNEAALWKDICITSEETSSITQVAADVSPYPKCCTNSQ